MVRVCPPGAMGRPGGAHASSRVYRSGRAHRSGRALLAFVLAGAVTAGGVSFFALPAVSQEPPAAKAGAPGGQGEPLHARSLELNEQGVQAAKANDAKRALALFEEALSADERNLSAAVNLATAYVTMGRGADARKLLERYAAAYPQDALLARRLGDVFFVGKEPKQALPWYEKAYQLDPAAPGVPARLATLYTLENRLADAVGMWRKAVAADPKNAGYLANLASVELSDGKADASIVTCKRALSLRPSKEVYITLGTAYEVQKQYGEALIAFRRARDLGDAREELAAKIEDLEKRGKK